MKLKELRQIIREEILKEITVPKLEIDIPKPFPKGFFEKLLPKTSQTVKEAESKILEFQYKKVFIHFQYFKVTPLHSNSPNKVTYGIHQSQYWLHGENINVTFIQILKYFPDGSKKVLGEAYVNTKVFLDEVFRVFKILDKIR